MKNETCAWCARGGETPSLTLKRCSWCRSVVYCGKDCQALHWRTHQRVCPPGIQQKPSAPANDYFHKESAEWQRPARVQKRIDMAETMRDDPHTLLPKGWTVCSSCRLPVLPEWLDCPSCARPISEEGDEATGVPLRERIEMQGSGHTAPEPLKALLLGAETGNLTMIMEAVGDGAEVRGQDPELYDSTALHYAAGRGQLESVNLLLKMGAGVDDANSNEETALHWAAEEGRLAIVQRLLEVGGDGARLNTWGEGVIDLAAANGHMEVVRWMRDRGFEEAELHEWEANKRPPGVGRDELLSEMRESEEEAREEERKRGGGEKEDGGDDDDQGEEAMAPEDDPQTLLSASARQTIEDAMEESRRTTRWERGDRLTTRTAADGSVYSVPRAEEEEGEGEEDSMRGMMAETMRVQREIEAQGGDVTPRNLQDLTLEREYVRDNMRKAREDFERRLEEREAARAAGEELPAVLPIAPEFDMRGLHPPKLEGEQDSTEGERRRAAAKRTRAEAEGERDASSEEAEGPQAPRRRAEGDYMEAIRREMESVGGIDGVPPLSSYLREAEQAHDAGRTRETG